MALKDFPKYDTSKYAADERIYVLDEAPAPAARVPSIPVAEALSGKKLYVPLTERTKTRVLFISRDESLLNPETQTLDGFLELSSLFAEVHILILRTGLKSPKPVLRVSDNVWLYTATARNWWWTPVVALSLIKDQLIFASGFRPDLIVARDPFESALVGTGIANRFKRPLQIHVLDDYTAEMWLHSDRHNRWRRYLPRYTLREAKSVRSATQAIKTLLDSRFTIPDSDVLPRFRNYDSLISAQPTLDLKEQFKPLIFFMAYIGPLTHESTVYRAIDAARFVLRNPRVGLLILGDGPARPEFEKRTKILNIDKQVLFITHVKDATAVLKSVNVLLVTDTDSDSDELTLKAAALGVPMVMAKTPLREDIFTDADSAFLFEPTDVQMLSNRINDMLNQVPLRRLFSDKAQLLISERFHESPEAYSRVFRETIEAAIMVSEDTTTS